MFRHIEIFSHHLSKIIVKTDINNENYDYYQYSIHGMLSFALYSTIAIILSFMFGYFPYILFIIPTLLLIRSQAGGSHALSSLWCLIATTFFYFAIGLSTIYLNNYYIYLFLLSFVAFTQLEEIPKYTKTATQHRKDRQGFFPLNYTVRLNIAFMLNIVAIMFYNLGVEMNVLGLIFDLSCVSTLISSCVLVNKFSLSNLSFKIFEWLG